MPAVDKTVPINVNIYLPKTTFNPYIRNAVSYANLGTATLTENASLSGVNSIADSLAVGTWTDLPGDTTAMRYKPLTGSLATNAEHEVFTAVFTANSGFHFAASGKSLVKKRILSTYPNQAENEKDFIKIPSGDSNKLYANRWRFVETPSNFDSNKLPKTVTIVAHYTAPDYRDEDALQADGTVATNATEILKNRGILLVPMLRKSTTTITELIEAIVFERTQTGFDGENDVLFYSEKQLRMIAKVKGVPGSNGILKGAQEDAADLVVSKSFTIGNDGVAKIPVNLPRVATSDEFKFHIETSNTVRSGVPTAASPTSIFKYADVSVKVQCTQTGSSFHTGSPGFTATTLFTGKALTRFNKRKLGARGTITANHFVLDDRQQDGGVYLPFSLQINPAATGGSDDEMVIDASVGDGGFLSNFTVVNAEPRGEDGNGGTFASLEHVKLVTSGSNVLIVGYLFLERLGKADVTFQLKVDEFLTVE